jgi:hypothetical protein
MMQRLNVSENKRFLIKEDGSPFFWLGDTAWELFHRLDREEAELYLQNRAERNFTVIQAVAIAEFEGVRTGNAYDRRPFLQNSAGEYDPTLPDLSEEGIYDYWQHVDYIVDKAAELGLYIGFLPTWGDKYNQLWGKGPVFFNGENAKIYGKWLGERYKDKPNIIWILGGDRPLTKRVHFEVIGAMAQGIKEGDGGRHLITFHPMGGHSSSHHVHDEHWLDFNMIQSGHGSLNKDNYKMISDDCAKVPVKPTLDGEPCYEDHPISFKAENGYFDAVDVRKAAYWAVFAGGFGHTYGHHSIWSMTTEPKDYFIMHWKEAILRPGAEQMQHVRTLIESRPFLDRFPDQSLIVDNYPGANHMQACRGNDYAFIYSPCGINFKVKMGIITGDKVKAHWYDPRLGKSQVIGDFDNDGEISFTPPSSGRTDDWVLILDDASKNYSAVIPVERYKN